MRKIPSKYENPFDNFIYKIVIFITQYLRKLNFTPNQITTIGNIFGVTGIYELYKNNYISSAVLYLIRYIFDCTDGYYARKYNLITLFGDWYDHISDLLVHLTYIILLYVKNRNLFKYFFIFYLILLLLVTLHLYYQERYYNKNEAPTLNLLNIIIPNFLKPKNKKDLENKLLISRWFGCGTGTLYQIIWLLIYDYYMNRK